MIKKPRRTKFTRLDTVRTKSRSLAVRLGLFILTVLVVVSCSASSYNKTALRMGCIARAGWYPWELTLQKKIFEKNNLNLNFTWFDNYTEAIKSMAEGKLDVNCQTLDETIIASTKGIDQSIVLVASNSVGNDKIIVREGIQSVIELKNTPVAVEPGTVAQFLLLLKLNDSG